MAVTAVSEENEPDSTMMNGTRHTSAIRVQKV